MVNREIAIIATIAAIMISSVAFGFIFQAQGATVGKTTTPPLTYVKPPGLNTKGAAGNTKGGAHDSSVHRTNPAAYSTHDSRPSMRNVK